MSSRSLLDQRLKRIQLAFACAIAVGSSGGCADWIPEETPPNLAFRCPEGDSDPTTAISFSRDILAGIFQSTSRTSPNCSCHQPTSPIQIGIQMAGLRLDSYANVRAGGNNTRVNIVVPGRPCSSALYLKLTATPPIGQRMPADGRFLSNAQLQIVHDWIAEGANDN